MTELILPLAFVVLIAAGSFSARRGLLARERTYQAMVNDVPLVLWSHDAAGALEWVNDTYCDYFGVHREDMHGGQWQDLVHPDDQASYAAAFASAVADRTPLHRRVRVRRRDGAWRWVESWGRPRIAGDGTYRGHIGVSADVTDEVEATAALETSEARFRSLVDLMPAGVYTCNGDGRITLFNEQAATIWGRRPEPGDTIGTFCGSFPARRPEGDLISPADGPMAAALATGTGLRNEVIVLDRPDGSTATIAAHIDPLRDDNGDITGAINVFVDVSDQVASVKALAESEAFTRRVLDQLFTFAGVLSPDGTLIEVNQAPLQAAGLTPADVLGRKFWDCYWWNYDPWIQHEVRVAVARAGRGEAVRYDVPVRALGGEPLWIDFQIGPLRNDEGEITHLIPSATDLTARRQAQQRLLETLEREREERRRVELLRRSAANLGAAVTVDDVAKAVLGDATDALGLTLASLDVLEGDQVRMIASPNVPADIVRRFPTTVSDRSLPGPVAVATGDPLVFGDPDEIGARFPWLARALVDRPLGSLAALPLRDPSGVAVAALVFGVELPGWFGPDRLELLTGIADQAAQALVRAQLHQQVLEASHRERAISRRLQESLLPDKLVEHPALPVTARYQAATDSLTVGGDWYDTFSWPDGCIGLIVGDVAGHDLDAAASMGRLRAALAALAPVISPAPSEVLAALDRCAEGPLGAVYVTAACVVIDPATGRARYATAGHPPPLVVRADGSTSWLDGAISPPAGVLDGGPRPEAHLDLGPRDTVLLYSDGLIERRSRPISDGMELLARLAGEGDSAQDLGHLVDRLIGQLAGTDDPATEDDVAVLAARYTPQPGPFHHRFPADTAELAGVRRRVAAWLDACEVTGPVRDDVQLVLSEAITNAIEHAYLDTAGTVTLDLTRKDNEIIARVGDQGIWRPPRPEPDRGRGTTIMAALTSRFDRRTDERGTTVTVHLAVDPGANPPPIDVGPW